MRVVLALALALPIAARADFVTTTPGAVYGTRTALAACSNPDPLACILATDITALNAAAKDLRLYVSNADARVAALQAGTTPPAEYAGLSSDIVRGAGSPVLTLSEWVDGHACTTNSWKCAAPRNALKRALLDLIPHVVENRRRAAACATGVCSSPNTVGASSDFVRASWALPVMLSTASASCSGLGKAITNCVDAGWYNALALAANDLRTHVLAQQTALAALEALGGGGGDAGRGVLYGWDVHLGDADSPTAAYGLGGVARYASPTGTAVAPCTSAAAPCSLSNGRGALASGDTLYLRNGTYSLAGVFAIPSSAEVRSYPGEWAVFDCTGVTGVDACVTVGTSARIAHVEVKNFLQDYGDVTAGAGALRPSGASARFLNVYSHHHKTNAFWNYHLGSDAEYDHCTGAFTHDDKDPVTHNSSGSGVGTNANCFAMGGTRVVVKNSTGHHCSDDAFDAYGGNQTTLSNSVAWSNGSHSNYDPAGTGKFGSGRGWKGGGESGTLGGHKVIRFISLDNTEDLDESVDGGTASASSYINVIGWSGGTAMGSGSANSTTPIFKNSIATGSFSEITPTFTTSITSGASASWFESVAIADLNSTTPGSRFFYPKAGASASLVDKGTADAAITYVGSAPDIGAREYVADPTGGGGGGATTPVAGTACVALGGVGWKGSTSLSAYPKTGYVTTCAPGETGCVVDIDDGAGGKSAFQRLKDAVALLATKTRVLIRNNSGATVFATGSLATRSASGTHQLWAYGSQRIKVDLSNVASPSGNFIALNGSGDHWKGFEITGGKLGWGSYVYMGSGSHNNIIEDAWLHDLAGDTSTNGVLIFTEWSHDNEIRDVIGWRQTPLSGDMSSNSTATHLPDPIAILFGDNTKIVRTLLAHGGDDCFDLWDSSGVQIIDSVGLNCGYRPDGSYSNNDGNAFKMGGHQDHPSTGNSAVGSVAVGAAAIGFTFNSSDATVFRWDTSYGNGAASWEGAQPGFYLGSDTTTDGVVSYSNAGGEWTGTPPTGYAPPTHAVSANPRFVSPSTGDFSLGSGSPAVGAGTGGANAGASEYALGLLKANWHLRYASSASTKPAQTYVCP